MIFFYLICLYKVEFHYQMKEAKTNPYIPSYTFKMLYFPSNRTYGFGGMYEIWSEGLYVIGSGYNEKHLYAKWDYRNLILCIHKSSYFLKDRFRIQGEIGLGEWKYKFYQFKDPSSYEGITPEKFIYMEGISYISSISFAIGVQVPCLRVSLYLSASNITPLFSVSGFYPPGFSWNQYIQVGVGIATWWNIKK